MSYVTTTDHDGIRVLTLDRPPVNAVDLELVGAVHDAIVRAGEDGACRGVVLTGAGRCFCAGIDVKRVPAYDPATLRRMIELVNDTFRSFYGMPKPTVAALNGAAIGAGLVLALGCDVRLAAIGAGPLGLTEITAGIPFPAAPMVVVTHELDRRVARDLVMTGRTFASDDPSVPGVIDGTCPPDMLLATAIAHADRAARLPAYGTVKRQLRGPAIAEIERIVRERADPMLRHWI